MSVIAKKENTDLYRKLLLIFSVIQLAVGLVLYLLTAILPLVLIVLAVMALGLFLLAYKWYERRWLRVVIRVITLLAVGVGLTAPLVSLGMMLYTGADGMLVLEETRMLICIMSQMILLFFLPVFAVCATFGRRLDLVLLRVFAILEVFIAGWMGLYNPQMERIVFGIDNAYFKAFFILCVAVTAVLSFMIFPVRWRRGKKKAKEGAEA